MSMLSLMNHIECNPEYYQDVHLDRMMIFDLILLVWFQSRLRAPAS